MKKTSDETEAEKLFNQLLQTSKDVQLMTLQGFLYVKQSDKSFFSILASIIKEIERGHLTDREKFRMRWSQLQKWAETRLKKDPTLKPMAVADLYCAITKKGYREKRWVYRIVARVKNKLRMRAKRKGEVKYG